MGDSSNTGQVALALGLGYLLLRSSDGGQGPTAPAAPVPQGGSTTTSTGGSSGAGGLPGAISTGAKVVAVAAPVVVGAVKLLGALPAGAGLVGLEVGLEAAGAYLGYEQAGVPGAIIGAVNPIVGNAGIAGFRAGSALTKDAGGNVAAQDTAGVGGAIIGVLCSLGELAAAAALLPTIGIAVGLAELVGEVLGLGNGDTTPPTPAQQVEAAYQVASATWAGYLTVDPDLRVDAAAQLVAWANGPDTYATKIFTATVQTPNPYRLPARQRVAQLDPKIQALLK